MARTKKSVNKKKSAPRKDVIVREKRDPHIIDGAIIANLVLKGDLRQFSDEQKVVYYDSTCRSLGLNPLTKPFDLIVLNDKEVLYPNKGCAEQLRKLNGISIIEMTKERVDTIFEVTVKVKDRSGRYEIATGSVAIVYPNKYKNREGKWVEHPLAGQILARDEYANARMKAETKAKRRATFAISGLGMLDESEIETIIEYPAASVVDVNAEKRAEYAKLLTELPENIKQGLENAGYETEAQYLFCNRLGWNHAAIYKEINRIVDMKNAARGN